MRDAFEERREAGEQRIEPRAREARLAVEPLAELFLRQPRELLGLALETLVEPGPITGTTVVRMLEQFERDYEQLYGEGTGYAAAGFSVAGVRVRASAAVSDFSMTSAESSATSSAATPVATRSVLFPASGNKRVEAGIYRGAELVDGSTVTGPAIIEYPNTTAVLHDGDVASVDALGNLIISIAADAR